MSLQIDSTLAGELDGIAAAHGCELLEVEPAGDILRLVLDRTEGVTLADCEAVSRQASALLDVADLGGARYILEVTSPGLDRKLYGPADYRRFEGREVRVTWKPPAAERKRTVVGRLGGLSPDDEGAILLTDPADDQPSVIPLAEILLARLVPEL